MTRQIRRRQKRYGPVRKRGYSFFSPPKKSADSNHIIEYTIKPGTAVMVKPPKHTTWQHHITT